jgi:hypothetical protein
MPKPELARRMTKTEPFCRPPKWVSQTKKRAPGQVIIFDQPNRAPDEPCEFLTQRLQVQDQ